MNAHRVHYLWAALVGLLFLASGVQAEPCAEDGELAWDWPPAGCDPATAVCAEVGIDGFVFRVGGVETATAMASERSVRCDAIGLQNGPNDVEVLATLGVQRSAASNLLVVDWVVAVLPLAPPENLQVVSAVPSGLAHHWAFDEGVGAIAGDSAGTADGSIVGASWATGRSGGALSFDGVDDLADFGGIDIVGSEITIGAWIYPSGGTSDGRVVSKAAGLATQQHWWMLDMSSRLRLRTGGVTSTLSNALTPPQDQWTHLAGTYDGTTMRMYVDGIEVTSAALSGVLDEDPSVSFAVGNQPQGNAPFAGLIDDVKVWSRALTPAEVAQEAQ